MGFIERLAVPWLGCAAAACLRDEMKQPNFKSVHLPVGHGLPSDRVHKSAIAAR
jgi:hypothetical protein